MRTIPCILVCAALLAGCGEGGNPKSAAPPQRDAKAAFAGAPAPLAKLHAESNELLGGGRAAFEARLRELRGYPVVVNKWASWCGPCAAEFPFFQKQVIERAKKVAFIGVNGNDNDANAKEFLARLPVSFPSYKDPDLKIAEVIKAVGPFPATVFYDRKGEIVHLKQGGYADERALAQDVGRYAR